VAANLAAGRDVDHAITMGLYGYPLLMAADILALDADEVPVGADQAQHLEIAIDLAQQFARTYRPGVLRQPRPLITDAVATLRGLDGRKMSKSYGNTITLLADNAATAKRIKRIVTDSTPPRATQEPRHVHADRAAPRARRPDHARRDRGPLPLRRDRLRRGQSQAG
jgi:tryptophanyl-tRNA synthetase